MIIYVWDTTHIRCRSYKLDFDRTKINYSYQSIYVNCFVFMFSELLYIAGKTGHHWCLCWRDEIYLFNSTGTMQNKSSHFHCLKCEFVCSDTNKVVAHRRQHQKLDSIMAAGFEKFTPFQPCNMESCAHAGKQTHYHCLSCQYAVLGLSQMSAHKLRHMEWHIPIFALSQV